MTRDLSRPQEVFSYPLVQRDLPAGYAVTSGISAHILYSAGTSQWDSVRVRQLEIYHKAISLCVCAYHNQGFSKGLRALTGLPE